MKRLVTFLGGNTDILVFQLTNVVYGPLLYLLLGNDPIENGNQLLKTIYLIEVYLALPTVIFYFNQRRISVLVENFGQPLYDSIAAIKLALSILTALTLVFALNIAEVGLLPAMIACMFGNAITPHWMLSYYSYTRFTLITLALRLVVLVSAFLGIEQHFLVVYASSLLIPGLYAFFYFRMKVPLATGEKVWHALTSVATSGSVSLVRNFTSSTLLASVLALVPPSVLPLYAASERLMRSGFSFLVPYILRINLKSSLQLKARIFLVTGIAAIAFLLYYQQFSSYVLLLMLAAMILSLDLLAFIQSEQSNSELISKVAYIYFYSLALFALLGHFQFYILLIALTSLFFLLKPQSKPSCQVHDKTCQKHVGADKNRDCPIKR